MVGICTRPSTRLRHYLSVLCLCCSVWRSGGCSSTFHPVPHLTAPVRYRFDVSGPAPLQQDVLVSQDSFHLVPVADIDADVTFRCNTGNQIPPDLVVARWTSDGESGSHRHFLFRQDVW